MDKLTQFWQEERTALLQRNLDGAAYFEGKIPEVRRRLTRRNSIAVTCMDERNALFENALQLLPGEAEIYGSAGGRITAETFNDLFGETVNNAARARRQAAIYLVTHESVGHPELGCAAFENDVAAQVAYFTALRQELLKRYPLAFVHALMFDTATGRIAAVQLDERDDRLAAIISGEYNLLDHPPAELAHAGYGIYVGNAYRAWVNRDNAYFRLSARNPNLDQDIRVALKVMTHHSTVDLSSKPIVLHLDYPIYPDAQMTGKCRRNMEEKAEGLLKDPALHALKELGQLKVMRTETEMESWRGMDVS